MWVLLSGVQKIVESGFGEKREVELFEARWVLYVPPD
jgi:hypothetical protein